MEYKLMYKMFKLTAAAAAGAVEELTREINEEIAKGWIPQGGICSATGCLFQALIKNS
jgi:hypothetical protein